MSTALSSLTCVLGRQSCVRRRGLGIYCPAVVGIERTGMVAALGLVAVVIVFDKERERPRAGIDHAALACILTAHIVLCPLGVDRGASADQASLLSARVKIAVSGNAGHIVHSGSHGRT